jgi:hypothetical protein
LELEGSNKINIMEKHLPKLNGVILRYFILFMFILFANEHICVSQGLGLSPFSLSSLNQQRKTKSVPAKIAPFMQVITDDSVELFWTPPSGYADSVQYYEVFYAVKGNNDWRQIKYKIPASASPKVKIFRNELNRSDSLFYFAVRSIDKNGFKSDFQSSADSTATPSSWYTFWKSKDSFTRSDSNAHRSSQSDFAAHVTNIKPISPNRPKTEKPIIDKKSTDIAPSNKSNQISILKGAKVSFLTTDDDKDYNTLVTVSINSGETTIATWSGTEGKWPNNSSSGPYNLTLIEKNFDKSKIIGKCLAVIVESPEGHDEWHFQWTIELFFSDNSTSTIYNWRDGNVDYDRTTMSKQL